MQKVFRTTSTKAEFFDAIDLFIPLAGFGLLLLYTRYLSPLEFGVLALLYVTVRVAHTVVVQGMTSAVARAWAASSLCSNTAARASSTPSTLRTRFVS